MTPRVRSNVPIRPSQGGSIINSRSSSLGSAFEGEAAMTRQAKPADLVANDPNPTSGNFVLSASPRAQARSKKSSIRCLCRTSYYRNIR
jgi:hypothetical protein